MLNELARSLRIFRSAMRNGSLRRVLVAFFLFNAQEYAVWIAVIVYAFELGGASAAGAVVVAQLVPAAVVAPFTQPSAIVSGGTTRWRSAMRSKRARALFWRSPFGKPRRSSHTRPRRLPAAPSRSRGQPTTRYWLIWPIRPKS